ncbi:MULTISPECIES: SDR family oxidoreductase [Mycolicibacterium]|uniref:Nucleoside-diphosphate-sugar epimerase n=1 Tax=Mycolicibacterium senegalense TaxID=1796 RepID=A0A378W9X4_9MYCO|nr:MULTISPECIES: SDR family oxidoreductase [Mycolicibacterium]MCV7338068.1 SDR family oxidoreductase [Mycolicibacterium senegalense]QZA27606.1 SDR family oxidoreductase [Mycolicibacterium senegalense]CDP87770.1 NAD-dependent epimerase/dehydratase [Mycolicibacterium farcinogenes]SUA29212.1 nucleoside-diphosphate-sugar epimerase [Mycolicibacterium senegalense]
MRIFVTGASGFIGSAVVPELLEAGHEVLGLARSDASAAALRATGADVHRGDLDDPDSLRSGAQVTDGVIHLAFVHDFNDFAAASDTDRRAIEALGQTLAGSGRPLVVASGTTGIRLGEVSTEDDAVTPGSPRVSETTALAFADRGVRSSVVRLPPSVHGPGDHGFVPRLIEIAREKGESGYPGDGANRWPAVHRLDAARLIRLAVESAPAGSRLHAVTEEGTPVRDIADIIGKQLQLPVTGVAADAVMEHFGWLGAFFSLDAPASSARTREQFDWKPTQIGLLDDLALGHYF